jgi:hypothetical protein
MEEKMAIRCPNCGNLAQRLLSDCLPIGRKCPTNLVIQTECPVCDYFAVMYSQNGKTIEAYAPGICMDSTRIVTAKPTDSANDGFCLAYLS